MYFLREDFRCEEKCFNYSMMPKSINVTKKPNKKVLVLSPVIEYYPKYEDHMIMCESKATIT